VIPERAGAGQERAGIGLEHAGTVSPVVSSARPVWADDPAGAEIAPRDRSPGVLIPGSAARAEGCQTNAGVSCGVIPDRLGTPARPAAEESESRISVGLLSGVTSHPPAVKETLPEDDLLPPHSVIGGYVVERVLGRGGMGTVYLARQLSLDRPVALKVMSKRWSNDPLFVSRFTREAYAAAQLSHPNIVQIHDIGLEAGVRFFSMEYVRGSTLAEVMRARGKLDPETAVGYVLQAARGLKHAHDRGMIHRDVKPENLLVDEEGLLKVADLGLVKTPDPGPNDCAGASQLMPAEIDPVPNGLTGVRIAVGTPAYMSPEQCRDAHTVDHRSDIYSLGCTLYALVTGRPPFDGTSAVDVMSKQAYDPLVPPEQIADRVPKELSAIIQRMMAKDPADRFPSMGELIRTLEAWLGVRRAGTFMPREEQIAKLEAHAREFNTAPAVVLRRRVVAGSAGGLALLALLLAFFGRPGWAFGLLGLVVHGGLTYFLIDGLSARAYLFTRVRQFLFGLSWGDWLLAAAALVLVGLLLAILKVLGLWLGFGIIGVGLAFAHRYTLDVMVSQQRRRPIEATYRLLRQLRSQGLDEEELRHFVAKYAGRDWEEFFEEFFGYEAKLAERNYLARGGFSGVREKYAAWRDPVIALLDRWERARREARERQLLREVEKARLLATGASAETAESRACAAAEAVVAVVGRVRDSERRRDGERVGEQPCPPVNVTHAIVDAAELSVPVQTVRRAHSSGPIEWMTGTPVRAVLAALLLSGCILWAYQNHTLPEPGSGATTGVFDSTEWRTLARATGEPLTRPSRPLQIAGIPSEYLRWVVGWNIGVAGVLLLASLFFRGSSMALLTLVGTAVVAVGHHHGIRAVEPLQAEHVSLLLGGVICLVGFRLGR